MLDINQNKIVPLAHPAVAARAFVMVNAEVREPEEDAGGHYDPATQTWIGGRRLSLASYSSRSNGSSGGYSYQSDD